jgi:hypothetical protein
MHLLLALVALLQSAPVYAAPDLVSVRDCGAVGDGKADDTQAFLDAVAQGQASGRHVYVPRGSYRVSKTITLENIGLCGPEVGAWPADIDSLPSILPTQTEEPVFHLLAGGSLRGIDITCSPDDPAGKGQLAVLISGIGCTISNCRIRYPWDAILTDGKTNVGRLNIENVFIVAPRNVGVRVTGTWDVPRLSNIEVWNAGPVPRGLEKGVGFLLGKNDLIRLTDCFVFAMQTGFLLEEKIEGCEIEGGTWGVMTGCATDYCSRGIVVRGGNTVSISGGTFWEHHESLLVEGEGARVRLTGAELKSNGAPAAVVRGGDHTVVTGCSILRPMAEFDAPAVLFEGGRLLLSDNVIDSQSTAIRIGDGAGSGIIRGNLIDAHGHTAVEGGKEGVVVESNVNG